jgi:hypothetical protein
VEGLEVLRDNDEVAVNVRLDMGPARLGQVAEERERRLPHLVDRILQ